MIIIAHDEIKDLRKLTAQIEMDLQPENSCKDVKNFKPDLTAIYMALFHIRETTKKIEQKLQKEFDI